MEIRIRYLSDQIDRLEYIGGKSDWIDLRCAEETFIPAGEMRLIPLGVAMKLPEGYEAHVVARSSTFRNYGIIQANSFGVVDESYSGDGDQWFFPAYATRDVTVRVNDRICQFRITRHQPEVTFTETGCLGGEDRGGFGSTGLR
ncbi:MAG: deoxyuridine 5'-triphosphate nucleotidohydrolase [Lachnospiraceae bacterium]|nr:deoxyuridine 5'-triphosphate nucleotidohydrolase [Lachnospiraceae bacterium]MBP5255156.1 deoxyuridine 5'-triphosphate nucleotidohydrolase [Lachnospiraceae bacterium]